MRHRRPLDQPRSGEILSQPMSGKRLEIVSGLYEATTSRHFDTARQYFGEDVVLVVGNEVSTEAGTYRGREEVSGWFARWFNAFAPDYQLEIEEIRDLGDRVFVVQRHHGRGRTSGVPVEMRNGTLISLRDGKVVRIEIYGDPDEALNAHNASEGDTDTRSP
jgi:ketosteroid isomerase-like protein